MRDPRSYARLQPTDNLAVQCGSCHRTTAVIAEWAEETGQNDGRLLRGLLLDPTFHYQHDRQIYEMHKQASKKARKLGYAVQRHFHSFIHSILLIIPSEAQSILGYSSIRLSKWRSGGRVEHRIFRVPHFLMSDGDTPECRVMCWNCGSVQILNAQRLGLSNLKELWRDDEQKVWRQPRIPGMFWAITSPEGATFDHMIQWLDRLDKLAGKELQLGMGSESQRKFDLYMLATLKAGMLTVLLFPDQVKIGEYEWIGHISIP